MKCVVTLNGRQLIAFSSPKKLYSLIQNKVPQLKKSGRLCARFIVKQLRAAGEEVRSSVPFRLLLHHGLQ